MAKKIKVEISKKFNIRPAVTGGDLSDPTTMLRGNEVTLDRDHRAVFDDRNRPIEIQFHGKCAVGAPLTTGHLTTHAVRGCKNCRALGLFDIAAI